MEDDEELPFEYFQEAADFLACLDAEPVNLYSDAFDADYLQGCTDIFDEKTRKLIQVFVYLERSCTEARNAAVDPSTVQDPSEFFNQKTKEFMQAYLFIEQECREAAEVCNVLSHMFNPQINNHNNN